MSFESEKEFSGWKALLLKTVSSVFVILTSSFDCKVLSSVKIVQSSTRKNSMHNLKKIVYENYPVNKALLEQCVASKVLNDQITRGTARQSGFDKSRQKLNG